MRERPTSAGLPGAIACWLVKRRAAAAVVGLVAALAGLLLAAAIAPLGAVSPPEVVSPEVVSPEVVSPEAVGPEVVLAADVTLPSVIVPPGAHLALDLESAGHAVHGTAPGPVRPTAPDPADASGPASTPDPVDVDVDVDTGSVAGPILPAVPDTEASEGPVPSTVRRPGGFALPVNGAQVSSTFGYRVNPMGGYGAELHTGVDWAVDCGTPVMVAEAGTVTESGWHAYGGGQRIVVDHGDGLRTTYNHLSALGVVAGRTVGRGELIGAVGSTGNSTGCHLHFEVMVGEEKVDPQPWL